MATLWTIGDVIPDIIIDENSEDGLETTSHPVQQGANISDHAYSKPKTVKISLLLKDEETYTKLLKLQTDRTLNKLVSPKRIWDNMILDNISRTVDAKSFNVVSLTAELKEIIIVKVETTSVPPSANHKDGGKKTGGVANAGAKTPSKVTEPKKKSALRTMFG